jgi:hypothetical protein
MATALSKISLTVLSIPMKLSDSIGNSFLTSSDPINRFSKKIHDFDTPSRVSLTSKIAPKALIHLLTVVSK